MEFRCSKSILKDYGSLELACQMKPQRHDQTTRPNNVAKCEITGLRRIRPEEGWEVGNEKQMSCCSRSVSGSGDKAVGKNDNQQVND